MTTLVQGPVVLAIAEVSLNESRVRHGMNLAAILASLLLGSCGAFADDQPSSNPATTHFAGSAEHVHVLGSALTLAGDDELVVRIRIDQGFHVNANPATFENLIPTSLTFAEIKPTRISYPPSLRFKPKFLDQSLDVYEGEIAIAAFFPKGTVSRSVPLRATVTAQACTDVICLPPADIPVPEN
jgi:hypothetical protein